MPDRNRKHTDIIRDMREEKLRSMRREQYSELGWALALLITVAAIISYWGRHGWPY